MPCPHFSLQDLGVRSPGNRGKLAGCGIHKVRCSGGFHPRLLLMAPSDPRTSHLSWCKSPWGYRTVTVPRIQMLPTRQRGGSDSQRNCSSVVPALVTSFLLLSGPGMENGVGFSLAGVLKESQSSVSRPCPKAGFLLGMSFCSSV